MGKKFIALSNECDKNYSDTGFFNIMSTPSKLINLKGITEVSNKLYLIASLELVSYFMFPKSYF